MPCIPKSAHMYPGERSKEAVWVNSERRPTVSGCGVENAEAGFGQVDWRCDEAPANGILDDIVLHSQAFCLCWTGLQNVFLFVRGCRSLLDRGGVFVSGLLLLGHGERLCFEN
jgi:hypothetical protein